MFSTRGYAATTVEDIARDAGISLRTFYRYCQAKEDALTPVMAAGVGELARHLARRPADETVADAVQAAFVSSTAGPRRAGVARMRRLIRVMTEVPAVRTRWRAAAHDLREQLLPVLAARTGEEVDSLENVLLASVLIETVTVALEHWAAAGGDEEFTEVSARALALLRLDG
ncbi:TetR/AcrR family transcriptional regulator [Streptomyces sp. NPDC087440]|uniref:TetR/AcrR family transcriptional regulator n=1 Tax=Streptomyces sp. NPDC087440 TaxID=3365790 RepID=UPI0037FA35A4